LSHSHFFQKFSSTLKAECHKSRFWWLFSAFVVWNFKQTSLLLCRCRIWKLLPLVGTQIIFLFHSKELSYGINLFRGEGKHYLRWNWKPDLPLPLREHYCPTKMRTRISRQMETDVKSMRNFWWKRFRRRTSLSSKVSIIK
jgi:hypothetical protein